MTDREIAERIAHDVAVESGMAHESLSALTAVIQEGIDRALAARVSPDREARAGSLDIYAEGVAKIAENSKTDDGWLKGLAIALRETATFIRLPPAVGEWRPTHRHYKGGLYREIARGKIEADITPCVIYEGAHRDVWVRPVDDFDAMVGDVRRFHPLPAPPQETKP